MELTELINSVHVIQVVGNVQRKDVTGIFYDSRKVVKGSVFVAVKGFNIDGHRFITDALNKGAVAVVLEDNDAVPDEIFIHTEAAKLLVKDSRQALAELSKGFYKNISEKIKLIGITGTKGKTTTSYIIKSILETAGNKTGLIGTISNYIGDKEIKSSLTTPESNDLNELLLEMYNSGCNYAVMEVSSHALALKRVFGLDFSAAVFTNISSDHLDFHQNFENYLSAKKILFDNLSLSAFGVYNVDDKSSPKIIENRVAPLYSLGKMPGADFIIKNISYDLEGTYFLVEKGSVNYEISTSLVGEFNAYNAAFAFAVTTLLGIDPETAVKGIKNTPQVPGRFEITGHKEKRVIIDYSHNADSLEKTLLAIGNIVGDEHPVYTVFGCGGNRDRTKRPVMGKIASDLSRKVFITSDNPRNEDPMDIIKEIEAGIEKKNYEIIEDREEAIKTAIGQTEPDAVILIAGKGHETYQEIKGVRKHFSDREVAEKYLNL
jgi:UDP-N-acetylmuramoyl-L-alanyl-D-glutamate--2,6-diaminopimelate ligase